MSPRAACRLETLGFHHVYDYMPGMADWLARGLPREGDRPAVRVGNKMRQQKSMHRYKDDRYLA